MFTKAKYGVDRFIIIDGCQLHYVDVGAGQPVLMIPGSMSTCRVWDRLVPRLCDRYRLLPLDYLGTGDSDKPKRSFHYTVEEQTDVLAKMITQLGMAPAHVIGASYGGAIAMSMGYRYRQLISQVVSIEGSVIKPDTLPGNWMSVLFKYPMLGDLFILLVRTGWLNSIFLPLIAGRWYPHMTPVDRQEMLEQLSYNARSATRHAWYAIDRSVQTSRDMEEEAKTLRVPTLYIYGTASEDFKPMIDRNLAFFARYLPHVQVAAVPGGIHDSAFQKPDEVAQLIREFLGPNAEG